MIGRVVEIASDDRHLAIARGFLTVSAGGEEVGRVPLDDIGVLLCHAHGLTYSNNLMVELARRGAEPPSYFAARTTCPSPSSGRWTGTMCRACGCASSWRRANPCANACGKCW